MSQSLETAHVTFFFVDIQGARGFPGTPGLPGIKGHRVSFSCQATFCVIVVVLFLSTQVLFMYIMCLLCRVTLVWMELREKLVLQVPRSEPNLKN